MILTLLNSEAFILLFIFTHTSACLLPCQSSEIHVLGMGQKTGHSSATSFQNCECSSSHPLIPPGKSQGIPKSHDGSYDGSYYGWFNKSYYQYGWLWLMYAMMILFLSVKLYDISDHGLWPSSREKPPGLPLRGVLGGSSTPSSTKNQRNGFWTAVETSQTSGEVHLLPQSRSETPVIWLQTHDLKQNCS